MKKILVVILASVTYWLVACNNAPQSPRNENYVNHDSDYFYTIVTSFSTSSLFMVLDVIDTQTSARKKVIIANHILYNTLDTVYNDMDSYVSSLHNILKSNDTLRINTAVYNCISGETIDILDTSLSKVVELGKHSFIDSFFHEGKKGIHYKCVGEDSNTALVIYYLISKWNVFVNRDDETGCATLTEY